MLGAVRTPASGCRRGGRDERGRPGSVELRDASRHQLLPDRRLIGRRQDRLGLRVGRGRDAFQDVGRILVACLHALQVQDGEPPRRCSSAANRTSTTASMRPPGSGCPVEARELDAGVHVGRLDGAGAGCQRDVVEAVGAPQAVRPGGPATRPPARCRRPRRVGGWGGHGRWVLLDAWAGRRAPAGAWAATARAWRNRLQGDRGGRSIPR